MNGMWGAIGLALCLAAPAGAQDFLEGLGAAAQSVANDAGQEAQRIGEGIEERIDRIEGEQDPPPAPNPPPAQEFPLDTSIVPRAHSTIPGYESQVEQCGEFVYRYFAESGHRWPDYPTLGQPAEYILAGDFKPSFPAYLNGSETPPRPGDILAARGPSGSGEYHTALIWKVEADGVWVYQANVPAGNASPDWQDHVMRFPMQARGDGTYYLPPLQTSSLGYAQDMAVVGWIHPAGSSRLPGAPQ